MLKQAAIARAVSFIDQPPSGGCVLKQAAAECADIERRQPPSGGCVLKLIPSVAL